MPDNLRKLFEALVRDHAGGLVAYLRAQVRDAALADDLFQETLLVAWRRLDDFDQTQPFGPWVRGIARNLVRNAARKRSADLLVIVDDIETPIAAAMAAIEKRSGEDWVDRLRDLRHCVDQLPAKSRDLIHQRYHDEHSAVVIAERSGRPATAVRKQLQRVRELLADCMGRPAGEAFS